MRQNEIMINYFYVDLIFRVQHNVVFSTFSFLLLQFLFQAARYYEGLFDMWCVSWEGFDLTIILFGRHANHYTNSVLFEMLFLQIVQIEFK